MKTLIVYYSYEGTTKSLVEAIQKKYDFQAEQIEVVDEKKHKGLVKYVWGGRQVIQRKEPKIMELKSNLNEYDRILLGTPVWASSFAPAIRSFLKTYDLQNKEVGLFCTNKGGIGNTFVDFEEMLKGSKIIGKVELTNVKHRKEECIKTIFNWIEKLNA